ncbi:MAG: hypothetical protein IPO56_16475 [Flavobacteriales bacterium]|nr:hypothetical protein [Flavobacteriales bacterium]
MIARSGRLFVAGAFTMVNGTAPRDRFAVFDYCTEVLWFADSDGDGLGDAGISTMACAAPTGFVSNNGDCDDADDSIGSATTWYFDGDEDEFGDPQVFVVACQQPVGYVEEGLDCDDSDVNIVIGNPCRRRGSYTVTDVLSGYPNCGCAGQKILVSAKVFLQGAYDTNTGLMRDDLRSAGLIPLQEPYTALGYEMNGIPMAGGDVIDPSVLEVTGPDAIVDWVILELRVPLISPWPWPHDVSCCNGMGISWTLMVLHLCNFRSPTVTTT